jgi:proteasome accessory factor C
VSKTARKLSRILAMIPWVIAHPGVSVDEVCERFGYTRRELADDLNLVFVCGLPGYGPGDLMVAYIDGEQVVVDTADYFSGAPRLSPAEALALLASGLAVLGTGQGGAVLGSAVEKLTRVLLPEGSDLLTVDLAGEPDLVAELRTAAANHQVVELTYTSLSREETTVREVEPWSVFSSLGNWYLSAHCRLVNDERVFRVDRIRQLQRTGEAFEAPAELPPPVVRYTPSDDDVHCLIELGPAAHWVAEYYPVDIIEPGEMMVVGFAAADPSVAARLLVRLGGSARLLEGPEVALATNALREKILAVYGE